MREQSQLKNDLPVLESTVLAMTLLVYQSLKK
jgi:hypothetical protein